MELDGYDLICVWHGEDRHNSGVQSQNSNFMSSRADFARDLTPDRSAYDARGHQYSR